MSVAPTPIVVWGVGAIAVLVVDAINSAKRQTVWGLIGNRDAVPAFRPGKEIPVLGREGLGEAWDAGVREVFVAVPNNAKRMEYASLALEKGFELTTVLHPTAVVARDVKLGRGSFVAAGAVINPGCRIGDHVFIGSRASIDHECTIEDGVFIDSGVTLGGSVTVGSQASLGLGTAVRDNISIGRMAVIGAGAAVVKDIDEGITAEGVPARPIPEAAASA
jgi:sugar O-acyltransferase (sialic acid O-acetyltransferase NeuD family)